MSFTGDGIAIPAVPKASNAKLQQLSNHVVAVPAHGKSISSVFNYAPVDNVDTSMKAGSRGPVGIADPVARERISHFDHERIPERVVHARGVGAHGVFKLHTSLSDVTCAKVLTDTSTETPVFVRFSTVLGSNGAAETAREVRGFATKFYTEQGNWDIVGNNIPVFFIQDGIKFPDLVHAAKPEPQLHMPQAQTAHDSFWDFISLMPESLHMTLWSMSDHAIPRSYRMIKGFGVNTFVLVSSTGQRTFVKFHWKPHLGTHGLVWDEALKLAGQDPDFLRRDLADAITSGSFPKYEFGVQLIPASDEHSFDFDLLDCTKLVPEELVPIKWVGTMTLNANPTNYFAETEQVAFCTSNVVPGIDYSDDPMLQLRNFSYFDTQISRLGGVNFSSLPINQGRCPFISTIRDGQSQHRIPAGPHYWPNRFDVPAPATKNGANFDGKDKPPFNPEALTFAEYPVEGVRSKSRPAKFADYVSQSQLFWNSQSSVEKEHIISAFHFELGRVDNRQIQERMMALLAEVDINLAEAVGQGLGLTLPSEKMSTNHGRRSGGENAMSMLAPTNNFTAEGRKIAIFAFDGFDASQVKALTAACYGIGVIPMIIGNRKGYAFPAGVKIGDEKATGVTQTHFAFEGCRSTYFDGLLFPSGDASYLKSLEQGRVIHFAREAFGHYKTIAALSEPTIKWLAHTALAGTTDMKNDVSKSFTEYKGVLLGPGITDQDSNILTKMTKGVYDASTFGGAFFGALAKHRHWDRDVSRIAF